MIKHEKAAKLFGHALPRLLVLLCLGVGGALFSATRPSQLSVGQAQRVIIAIAILHRPPLLIADEPHSALNTDTQSEILRLFAQLNRELGMGILYISNDLLSVAALCHRIAILNDGEIVEIGPPSQIFGAPRHLIRKN